MTTRLCKIDRGGSLGSKLIPSRLSLACGELSAFRLGGDPIDPICMRFPSSVPNELTIHPSQFKGNCQLRSCAPTRLGCTSHNRVFIARPMSVRIDAIGDYHTRLIPRSAEVDVVHTKALEKCRLRQSVADPESVKSCKPCRPTRCCCSPPPTIQHTTRMDCIVLDVL
ncbi:hypothetical protein J6590_060332 [Homalodisca vitripennis]|nr:hypothetical protein J6590_060332 [Homalodisca vitripennis]